MLLTKKRCRKMYRDYMNQTYWYLDFCCSSPEVKLYELRKMENDLRKDMVFKNLDLCWNSNLQDLYWKLLFKICSLEVEILEGRA